MISTSMINLLYKDHIQLVNYLTDQQQIGFIADANNNFKKYIALAAASYLEYRVYLIIEKLFNNYTNENSILVSFTKKRAMERKYHEYFEWRQDSRKKNGNKFFSFFGNNFTLYMKEQVRKHKRLETSIDSFITIGNMRNELIHSNIAAIQLENNTPDEILSLYMSSLYFVRIFPYLCKKYIESEIENINLHNILYDTLY